MPISFVRFAAVVVCLLLVPAAARAQGSLTGVVKDTSGAVLPGVTVEASSPALIEKARAVVTDGSGQYRIVDLRPGTYSVSFSLAGFNAVRRDGIELTGSFTATVNADMRVGALEETVVVTGDSPIVDVQSSRRQQTLDREVLTTIPSARSYQNIAALVPGITLSSTQDVGGLAGSSVVSFQMYGGRTNEGRLQVDGIGVGGNTGGTSYYVADIGNAAEVTVNTSGGTAEAEVGGPVMNIVPRTGGNTMTGSLFLTGANGAMQGDNFTDELRAAGLSNASNLIKIWDINGAVGGPIQKDRLWWFLTSRYHGNRKYIEGMYVNANAGNPDAWTYEPDLSRPAIADSTWKNTTLRLTWQASARNKFNVFWDEQRTCVSCTGGGSATTAPEAADGTTHMDFVRAPSITWTSPATNRLLFEAGWGYVGLLYGRERDGNNRDLVRVTEQGGLIPGLTYRSMTWQRNRSFTPRWRAAASYVTGAHSLKIGAEGLTYYQQRTYNGNNQSLNYRLNNGVPNQLTMFVNNFGFENHTKGFAAYAQEQWTLGRLTLQGGVRYDNARSSYPEQRVGPDRFIPELVFPEQIGVAGYHDISPRLGAALDVFGNGKTAVKVNLGRYLEPVHSAGRYIDSNPIFTSIGGGVPPSTTRSWTDVDGDYVPDCDLLNPAGNSECGPLNNQSFGRVTSPSVIYDPDLLEGWDVRGDDWQFGASIQQQVLPQVSVQVGYNRRWFGNFDVTDNLLVSASDYDVYSITAPVDDRLPGGGGYVIGDLWNISPQQFGQTRNFVTAARNFGEQTQYWHGVDVNVAARLRNGLTIQGGTSTGRQVTDSCDVIVDDPSRRNCHVALPFLTQLKGLATYTVPRIDVQLAATLQSRPGAELVANLVVPSATVAGSLGRPLSGGAANVTINLLNPGQMYGDRINQLDVRVGKVFRFGRTRANIGLDLFNALNSSAVQTYNGTYGARWLTPTLVMPARFAKVSAQLDF